MTTARYREQQDMLQLVELTLGPARVGDIAEQAEQLIERSHGNLLAVWLPCKIRRIHRAEIRHLGLLG